MKKRCMAMLLSLVISTAMIAEASAAAFDSQAVEAMDAFGDGQFSDSAESAVGPEEVTPTPEEVTPTPEEVTPTPEEVTPTPEEVTPTPEEVTPTPEEVTPTPEEVTPTPEEVTPTPEEVTPTPQEPVVEENAFSDGLFSAGEEVGEVESEFSGDSDGLIDSIEAGSADAAGAIVSVTVNESSWETSGNSFKLKRNNPTAEKGNYYNATDGILHITTVTSKGNFTGNYLFDASGLLITGKKQMTPGTPGYSYTTAYEFYFTDKAHAALYAGCEGMTITPWTSDLGQQKKDFWLWDGKKFSLYSSAGRGVTMAELDSQYKSMKKYVGYYKINGEYYCLKSDGTPKTGDVTIKLDNKSYVYYFQPAANAQDIPGKMFYSGWHCVKNKYGERWRYYSTKTNTERGRCQNVGKVTATYLDKAAKGDYKYLLSPNGYILLQKRAKASDGYYYGSNKQGRIIKQKLVKYGSYRYYFDKYGRQVSWKNVWKRCTGADNRFYYFGSTAGRVEEKTGWQKVTNSDGKMIGWFYFTKNGNHYRNYLTKQGRYFDEYGRLASGIKEVNGKTYFFQVSSTTAYKGQMLKSTMIKYKNKWYYAQSNGVLWENGWKKISGKYYYFKDFVAQTKTFAWRGKTYGYLNSSGVFSTGWVVYSNSENKVRYVNPKGNGFYKDTNVVIDGLRYYFDKEGFRINDLTSIYKGPYSVKVDRVNGVMTVYTADGKVPVKTIRVSVGNSWTPTPTGTYKLARSARWQSLMGPSWGQYGTHVVGAGLGGIFVHSIACSAPNSFNLPAEQYNKLGSPASHGCIRVCVGDAKWVYDNCNGATITIFDGSYKGDEVFKGPLGRRALVPLKSPYNYDPTDPAV